MCVVSFIAGVGGGSTPQIIPALYIMPKDETDSRGIDVQRLKSSVLNTLAEGKNLLNLARQVANLVIADKSNLVSIANHLNEAILKGINLYEEVKSALEKPGARAILSDDAHRALKRYQQE